MLLKNKKILISGLANKYSIAAGIAYAMHREGAELAFTYQNERLLKNLVPIAKDCNSEILIECDVSNDDSIASSFKELSKIVDVMIIIGSFTSANSKRLTQLAKQRNENSYQVVDELDLKSEWFEGVDKVGISAGASTPDNIIQSVTKHIKNLSN